MNIVSEILANNKSGIAITDGNVEVPYKQLNRVLDSIISVLRENNIQSLAIHCNNSIDWCLMFLACLYADIKIFPFSITMNLSLVIGLCDEYCINAILSDQGGCELEKHSVPSCSNTCLYVINKLKYDDELEDVATVLFTSGSTGEQKGVMLTAENILSNVKSVKAYMHFSSDDTIMIIKPLTHSSTLTAEFLSGVYSGAKIFINDHKFDTSNVIHKLNNKNITVLCGVPTMFAMLVRYSKKYSGTIRAISVSGSYLDETLLFKMEDMFKCEVYHVYGLTEASPRVTFLEPKFLRIKVGSIGKPIPDVEVEIESCDGDGIGEIVVIGKNVMKGYLRNDTLTKQVLKNGRLYTGDLAYLDKDGFIFLKGRKDDMIARGGVNIWPAPIEKCIKNLPGVIDVAIIGIKNYFYSQKIFAFVVMDMPLNKNAIANICMENNLVCPDEIVQLDFLPRNAMGKIEKSKLYKLI